MIEIVERATCPTCDGTPKSIDYIRMHGSCATCQEEGTVTRVLATFADAAALRERIAREAFDANQHRAPGPFLDFEVIRNVPDHYYWLFADAVLAALGVTNEPQ